MRRESSHEQHQHGQDNRANIERTRPGWIDGAVGVSTELEVAVDQLCTILAKTARRAVLVGGAWDARLAVFMPCPYEST